MKMRYPFHASYGNMLVLMHKTIPRFCELTLLSKVGVIMTTTKFYVTRSVGLKLYVLQQDSPIANSQRCQ